LCQRETGFQAASQVSERVPGLEKIAEKGMEKGEILSASFTQI